MRHNPVPAIRRAVPADAAKLAQFAARTFAEAFAADNRAADMALHIAASYSERKQSLEIASPALETLLAETGEALAGYAQLRQGLAPSCVAGAGRVELWRFYVDAAWHGRGAPPPRAVDLARSVGAKLACADLLSQVRFRDSRHAAFLARHAAASG